MGQEMSVLKEAREIVRNQPMNIHIGHLRSCADHLHEAWDVLKVDCTRSAAIEFNAAFARTLLAMERVTGGGAPNGGALRDAAQLAPEFEELIGC